MMLDFYRTVYCAKLMETLSSGLAEPLFSGCSRLWMNRSRSTTLLFWLLLYSRRHNLAHEDAQFMDFFFLGDGRWSLTCLNQDPVPARANSRSARIGSGIGTAKISPFSNLTQTTATFPVAMGASSRSR